MSHPAPSGGTARSQQLALAFAALGVVFGDIGTSPLYAVKECFSRHSGVALTPENVLGVLSLVFWSLIIVVSIKYVLLLLRVDNRGEGGILALMSLVLPKPGSGLEWERRMILLLGLFGSALLYGDGMITPAISVLSAIEGLKIATPVFEPYVVPITICILILLFGIQRRGTAGVSRLFGPIVLAWFLALGISGLAAIFGQPEVLRAVHPGYAMEFLAVQGWRGFMVLGAVFLVITGGEALYADMGHFGPGPIKLAWFGCVLPCLLLQYFGQGALLLSDPGAVDNPFYRMVPGWALYPMILLATLATCTASQAMISGAFSLTRQAVQFGYYPRVEIIHTSPDQVGQIYIPSVNWALMGATIGLVISFGSSENLSGAYGVAVGSTMVITTVLAYVAARRVLGWGILASSLIAGAFLTVDLAFFGANILKVWQGGWVPLMIGTVVYLTMSTWHQGRQILADRIRSLSVPLDQLLARIAKDGPLRVSGTAIYMTSNPDGTPLPLQKNLDHNKVLHERVVLLNIATDQAQPHVPDAERVEVEALAHGFWRIRARYGFMDSPSIREILEWACARGFSYNRGDTTFFLGRESVYATELPGMALWREQLFASMARNATRATDYFDVPRDRVIELGTQIQL